MRDLVILVADKNMEAMVRGIFDPPQGPAVGCHRLGCGSIALDCRCDLHVAAGLNDPGLYERGSSLLTSYRKTHRHALVLLDVAWEGSPGKQEIEAKITSDLERDGWTSDRVAVVAIDPELENWIWMDSPHVASSLGFPSLDEMREWLAEEKLLARGAPKPQDPKLAVEKALRRSRQPRSSSRYRSLVERSSFQRCQDPAFLTVRTKLQEWFPP